MAKEGRENFTTAEGTILCRLAKQESERMRNSPMFKEAMQKLREKWAKEEANKK